VSSAAPPPSLVLASVGHPHCLLVVCSQPRHSRAGAVELHHGVNFTVVQYSEPSAASYSSPYFGTESPLPRLCFPVQCHLVSLAVTLRCRATGTERTTRAASARSNAGRGVDRLLRCGPCTVLCNRAPWATQHFAAGDAQTVLAGHMLKPACNLCFFFFYFLNIIKSMQSQKIVQV
jgi:hypothetical protein